jgi:hypothetical protein
MRDYAQFLRAIAEQVFEARLSKGRRVLDATDLREWLIELAEKAEQAETLEQFLSQISKKEGGC